MPASPTTHPTAAQLQAYALGKLPPAELAGVAQHLETCPQCLEIASGKHADSFVGKLRAAHPQQATADWSPQSLLDARVPPRPEQANVPPELRASPKYRVERELGRGGMGVIYLAEHVMMRKRVALKVISQALLSHADAEVRFQTEVRAAARLDHPNIVKALDADRLGALYLLVMDYVDGLSLGEVLKRKGPFPLVHACHYIRQAALGLQHAYEQGMVHRDIKPHNLMLTRDGKVKILDFGLARLARGRPPGKPGVTHVGDFMGTPDYVAPEQAMDASTADIRADLYSLGCTMYCLLAGRPPFQGDTQVQVILGHLEKEVAPVTELRADVPAELWAVLVRLLEKDPAKRYQKPVELAQALTPFCKPGAKRPVAPAPATQLPVSAGDTGTKVATNTSKLPGRTAPAPLVTPVVVPPPAAAPFAEMDVPGPELIKPRASGRERKSAGRWKLAVGACIGLLLVAVSGWLLSGVIFWPTPHGLVKIETDDPLVEIVFDKTGPTIKGTGKQPVTLQAGEHGLLIKRGDFSFETEKLVIKNGATLTLKIELLKGNIQVLADDRVIGVGEARPATLAGTAVGKDKTLSNETQPRASPPEQERPLQANIPFDAQQARKHQETWAEYLRLQVEMTNIIGMKLVLIPPGHYVPAPPGDGELSELNVPAPFYLGMYEVTQEEYQSVMGQNPSYFSLTGGGSSQVNGQDTSRFPVDQVSWHDAIEYCNKLSEKERRKPYYDATGQVLGGDGYRLPREMEWEYACRAGTTSSYSFGDIEAQLGEYGWDSTNSGGQAHLVGEKKRNPFGLYDVHGNVWEWCEDTSGLARLRRGGSWKFAASLCRSAHRAYSQPSMIAFGLGFRLARSPSRGEIEVRPKRPLAAP